MDPHAALDDAFSVAVDSQSIALLPVEDLRPSQYRGASGFPVPARAHIQAVKEQRPDVVVVARQTQEGLEILSGIRFWLAAQSAKVDRVPVLVAEDVPEALARIRVLEDFGVKQSDPFDLADLIHAEQMRMRKSAKRKSAAVPDGKAKSVRGPRAASAAALSRAFGMNEYTLRHLLRLRRLDPRVREMVRRGALSQGHAKTLVGLPYQQSEFQYGLAKKIVERGLTVRQAEKLRKEILSGPKQTGSNDADIRREEMLITEAIGSKAAIRWSGKEGSLVIHFGSLEVLEGIKQRLGILTDDDDLGA